MLGLVGVIFAEQSTGISWADAGKVLNEQPSYLGFDINVPVTTLVWIEVLSMGFAEVKRSAGASSVPRAPLLRVFPVPAFSPPSTRVKHPLASRVRRRAPPDRSAPSTLFSPTELDSEKRCYPGGYFDPLGFAGPNTSPEAVFKLKTAELKHGRLAMVGMLGISIQALKNGEGALEALQSVGK